MAIDVGVVGAGPAGMMAALEAARRGASVSLFDRNQIVGRKLLVTGNGRCNLTNANVASARYACADSNLLERTLAAYGREKLLDSLDEMGVLTYATPDGWYYPLSNSAATVVNAFSAALDQVGVKQVLQTKISSIRRQGSRFLLEAGGPAHTFDIDRVIVATGGKAYPALGAKGEFFAVLKAMGHMIAPVEPALVPIRAEVKLLHKLQGVRLDVGLALYRGERKLGQTVGNLMFTQFGFSGPAAMDMSYLVGGEHSSGGDIRLVLDLVPNHLDQLRALVDRKRDTIVPAKVVLGAVLPVKVPPVFLGLAGLSTDVRMNQLKDHEVERLLRVLTGFEVAVRGTRGFQFSQLSTGGVPLSEVNPETMESRRVQGLFLAGEVLDVVGPCGGYNLQFSFSSGALAGSAAGR